MKAEIKSTEALYKKLQKKYDSAPNQTVGTILCSLELIIFQLKELDEK